MTAYSLRLGYFASGILFAAVIAAAAMAYWRRPRAETVIGQFLCSHYSVPVMISCRFRIQS
ncbi:putative membrane-anchored protein [Arthrobacter sp. UYEF21]